MLTTAADIAGLVQSSELSLSIIYQQPPARFSSKIGFAMFRCRTALLARH
jgi:hypothetical protein